MILGARVAGVLRDDLLLDGLRGVLALELVDDLGGGVQLRAVRALDLLDQRLVDLRRVDLDLRLADLGGEIALKLAELLDRVMRDVERIEDLGLGNLVGARLDHQDRVLGAGDDQVEVLPSSTFSSSDSSVGLTTKLPSILPTRTAPTGVGSGTSLIISAAEAPFIARMS